jgi:hypothetical protein
MNAWTLAALVLLVAMVYLVAKPFITPAAVVVEPGEDLTDPGARARAAATVQRVGTASPAASTSTSVDDVTDPTTPAAAPEDVRAAVEAAIAARKAQLKARHCASCDATLDANAAFCSACGTKVEQATS